MFFHSLFLLRDISPRWVAVCSLLDNMNTWFFHRIYFPVIFSLSKLLMTIMSLFWYSPLQRVQIHLRTRVHIKRWVILWKLIFWRKWNEEMVICILTLILAVGRSMKWMMTLNKLSNFLEENTRFKLYIWLSDTTNGERDLVEGNNIFNSSENGWERGVIQIKTKMTRKKKYCKGNEGVYFGESCNRWGDMVAWFRGAWSFLLFIHTFWTTWWWIHNWV